MPRDSAAFPSRRLPSRFYEATTGKYPNWLLELVVYSSHARITLSLVVEIGRFVRG